MRRSLLKQLKEKTQEEYLYLNRVSGDETVENPCAESIALTEKKTDMEHPVELVRQMRFCRIPEHRHDLVEICYTCSGSICHMINGQMVQSERGGMLLMGTGTAHEVLKTDEEDIGIIVLLKTEFIHEIFSQSGLQDSLFHYLQEILLGMCQDCSWMFFQTAKNIPLQNLIENLIMMYLLYPEEKNTGILRMTIGLIFLYLMKDFQEQFEGKASNQESRSMMEVMNYVENNFRDASLKELSGRMGFSQAALSRFIKKHTGSTFKDMVLNKRFKAAEELLKNTNDSINEIAVKIGYENGSHFYQKFYERYQMTPNDFRTRNRRKTNSHEKTEGDRKMYLQNKLGQYWTDRAESYSRQNLIQLRDNYEKWKQIILEYLPEEKKAKVLDVGTGPGIFAILLAGEGYQVTAVDQNRSMLYYARKNAQSHNVSVGFFQVEGSLPFQDESFDVVVSRDVVWMQLSPEEVLEEWYRVLKPGGCILYFDAEWYGYLRNVDETREYKAYRRIVKEKSGFVYPKAIDMEKMAFEFPLTYRKRPEWDISFWEQYSPERIFCKEDLNKQIYSEMEQMQYAKTPELLVYVKK